MALKTLFYVQGELVLTRGQWENFKEAVEDLFDSMDVEEDG